MTDGEGRARFQYADCPEGPEREESQDEVRLAVPTPYRKDALGRDVDPGGGREDVEDAADLEVYRRDGRGGGPGRGGDWSPDVQDDEDQEAELEVEVVPTLGVRITAPIRDPDCVSEEEEQQPYPALAPVAFFCLKQTTRPRNWCLRVVCNPYPFTLWNPRRRQVGPKIALASLRASTTKFPVHPPHKFQCIPRAVQSNAQLSG